MDLLRKTRISPGRDPSGFAFRQFLKPTNWIAAQANFKQALSKDYDLLILTGGAWNSTVVRTDPAALALINAHYGAGKTIASICSATQILINAGLTEGFRLTGTKSIQLDLENAGAAYVDQAVVTDRRIISSRNPEDLLPFVTAIKQELLR